MKKSSLVILCITIFIISLFIAIYPNIRYYKNNKLYIYSYSDNMSMFEDNMCLDDSYSYNEDLDITITNWDIQSFLMFNVFILEYEDGNKCIDRVSIIDKEWINGDEIIKFNKDNTFYYVSNNKPINCFKNYNTYSYNRVDDVILLMNVNDEQYVIDVVSISNNELILRFDEVEKVFINN